MSDVNKSIEAVWKIESTRLIAAIARVTHDIGIAEELAQDALVTALEVWPEEGIPDNPGAWLMKAAKRRAIDSLRRGRMLVHICYKHDKTVLGRTWTTGDILRLTLWRTVSPFASLLFVIAGLDAIYDRKLIGILWLVAAALSASVGTAFLRSAEGMKLRRVKSGELYKRAFVLAKNMGTRLQHVYVVPAGRGHLTNAYGLSQSIALTDNYGRFLNGAQLDFVIGHELAHVKERHGRKKLLILGTVYAGVALVCFKLPHMLFRFRPLLDIFLLLIPVLTSYYFSRRFEYAADAASVEYTHDAEAAIRGLANLHRLTQVPTDCGRLSELFLTHPAFTRRAWAIGESSRMPADRLSEVIHQARLRAADSL
jgi:Zn-dependent protease with chaperone function